MCLSLRPATQLSLRPATQRADLSSVVFQLAEYGDVDAPIGAIVGGAFVVTAIALASTFAFKSGFEESVRAECSVARASIRWRPCAFTPARKGRGAHFARRASVFKSHESGASD